MNLTPQQERMISSFLRKTAEGLRDLPDRERAQSLARVRSRVQRELEALGDGTHEDEAVAKALLRSKVAAVKGNGGADANTTTVLPPQREVRRETSPRPQSAPSQSTASQKVKWVDEDRKRAQREPARPASPEPNESGAVWLGVCANVADASGVSAQLVRAAFVVFGLVTGPLALWLYLGTYAFSQPRRRLRAHGMPLLWAALQSIGWTAFLYAIVWGVNTLVFTVYRRVLDAALEPGPLLWLDAYGARMALAVAITSMPALMLGALPMANDWDATLKKLGQAVIAVYALALLAGLVCLAVGVGLQAASDFFA